MRIIFKILAAPFVVLLTIFVAVMSFIINLSGWVFGLVSGLLGLGGIITLFTGPTFNGIMLLVLAFLVSPYGLPMLVVYFVGGMQSLNYTLRDFITS